MTIEKLSISEIDKHKGYSDAVKSGNTVWNARSTQIIDKDDTDYDSTNSLKIKSLEKKVDLLQDTLEKILDRLTLTTNDWK
mgnify:FL=1|jgi:hypothetical protein|tara:strand:+ start:527 stop:769 length:243 start_codon:yes stop_codon:yes gene_type:complete